MLAATIATAAGVAGANADCGTISFSFEGTRLLNDGISHKAGPFTIDLPAGTYDVVMRSGDSHSTQDGQIDQEAERWWFALDSGWNSTATDDLPDELDANLTMMAGQVIPASTSITLHHLGQGGINSVNPLCVGFTGVDDLPADPDAGADETPDRTIPDGNADPGADEIPDRAITDVGGPDPGDDGIPDRAIPAGDDADPDRAIPDGDERDPDPADDGIPDRAIPDPGNPNDLDRGDPGDPDDPERVPTDPVVPELAITGAGQTMIRLLGLAVILMQVGFLMQLADRHRRAGA